MVRRELAALLRHAVAAAAGGEDDRRRVELVLAAGRAPAVLARLERAERAVREERAGAGLERVAERLRDRVAGAVADLEQALGATRRRSGRGGSRRSRCVNSTPSSSSQWIASRASPVSTSTSRMSALSWELRQTSAACCSGESSSPNAAWIPPCALAELQAWIEPLVASPTRAPARSAETAAARPEAPLPITSTSKEGVVTAPGYLFR